MFSVGQKIFNGFVASTFAIIVLMPHLFFEAIIEMGHLFVELLDITFEAAESTLDFIIEFLFETSVHHTQIVVFYIMAGALIYGFYKLIKKMIVSYENIKTQILMAWILYKMQWVLYFKTMPAVKRLQWFAVGMGLVSYIVLFGF